MSFDYVNGMMQDALNFIDRELGNENDRERIQQILSYLTGKTMELRRFLHGIPSFTHDTKRSEPGQDSNEKGFPSDRFSEAQEIIFEKWSNMNDKVGSTDVFTVPDIGFLFCTRRVF